MLLICKIYNVNIFRSEIAKIAKRKEHRRKGENVHKFFFSHYGSGDGRTERGGR